MSYLLFRLIFKEIAIISKKDPFVGSHIKGHLKTHLAVYYQSRERMSKKIKKQSQNQLASAFLNFLKLVNLPNQHKGQAARLKLIQIFLGINIYLDQTFNLRRQQPKQIKFLQTYPQFVRLSLKDKEFVKSVVERVLEDDLTYPYSNLTDFFKDQQANIPSNTGTNLLPQLAFQKSQYAQKVANGQIQGVSKQFAKIYFHILTRNKKQNNLNSVLQSYDQSRYILLNFNDIFVKK